MQVWCVRSYEAADAHFRAAALAATTTGRLERSSRPQRRLYQTCCNLRFCAAMQHAAALQRRRSSFPYLGVRRRRCGKPNGPWALSFP